MDNNHGGSAVKYAAKFALVMVALATLGACAPYQFPSPTDPAPDSVCHEDEPCWDCETMGNGICGPLTGKADASGIWIDDANGALGVVRWDRTDAVSLDAAWDSCIEAADQIAESDIPNGSSPYLTELCEVMVGYLER